MGWIMNSHSPGRMAVSARWILSLAFLLGIVLPLASLPPFQLGYWGRAEPLVVGWHACAALAALGMGLYALAGAGRVAEAFSNSIVLLPLALGAFSLIAAPLVQVPRLSVLGAPQSGQGALWYVEFALMIAAARVVRVEGHWRAMQRGAILAVLAVAAIKGFDWWWERQGGNHLLIWVAAYYAWLGVALPAFTDDAGRFWRPLGWIATCAVVLAARSSSAVAALILGILVMACITVFDRQKWIQRAAGMLPVAILVAAPAILLTVDAIGSVASLADRRSLLLMAGALLRSWSPGNWLVGEGWGRTQDMFHANLAASQQVLWNESWIFMSSDYFHSHSALVEALLSAGIPGLVLTAAWFAAITMGADAGKRRLAAGYATALAVLSALWFQLTLSLPLAALALAALAPLCPERPVPRPSRLRLVAAFCVIAAIAFGGVAMRLYVHGRQVDLVLADLLASAPAPHGLPADPRGSDHLAAGLIRDGFNRLEGATTPAEREQAMAVARLMTSHLADRIPLTTTVGLVESGLSWQVQVQMIGSLGWMAGPMAETVALWPVWLDRALALAPRRTDLAISYFTHLAMAGNNLELARRTGAILAVDPGDPVGLYFLGLLAVQKPDLAAKRRGIELLRASVAAGIERYMPIDPALQPLLR